MGNAPYLETEPREMRHWVLQYASYFADKSSHVCIQINKDGLSLETNIIEAQHVEELWRSWSYYQWISVYFNFKNFISR